MKEIRSMELGSYDSHENNSDDAKFLLASRIRCYLCQIAGRETPITYQALATALQLSPPNTIRQLTDALECLMEQDVNSDMPLIASLVISKNRGGLPSPGFFECARRLGRFDCEMDDAVAGDLHRREFNLADQFWSAPENFFEQDH